MSAAIYSEPDVVEPMGRALGLSPLKHLPPALLLEVWFGETGAGVLRGTEHQGGLCTNLSPRPQLRASKDDCQREKEEKEKLKKMLKQHKQVGRGKNPSRPRGRGAGGRCLVWVGCPRALSISPGSSQASGERLHPEPLPGPLGPACPMYQYQYSPPVPHPVYHGFDEWQQIRYPPAMPGEHAPGQNFHHFPPVSILPTHGGTTGSTKSPASGFGVCCLRVRSVAGHSPVLFPSALAARIPLAPALRHVPEPERPGHAWGETGPQGFG